MPFGVRWQYQQAAAVSIRNEVLMNIPPHCRNVMRDCGEFADADGVCGPKCDESLSISRCSSLSGCFLQLSGLIGRHLHIMPPECETDSSKLNVDPNPSSDVTVSLPPSNFAACEAMVSPSPTPGWPCVSPGPTRQTNAPSVRGQSPAPGRLPKSPIPAVFFRPRPRRQPDRSGRTVFYCIIEQVLYTKCGSLPDR